MSSPFPPDGKEEHGGAPVGGFYRPGLKVVQARLYTVHWLNSITWSYVIQGSLENVGCTGRKEHGFE